MLTISILRIYVRHWLTRRPEQVDCKGKGMMTTYWCEPRPGSMRLSFCEGSESSLGIQTDPTNEMIVRLVDWNVRVFVELLNEHRGISDNEYAPTETDVDCKDLSGLITAIAGAHKMNPFHNFERTSHVVFSTKRLLDTVKESGITADLGGALTDPLSRFAILFGILVYGANYPHQGSNGVEANSVIPGWEMFLDQQYENLRTCLFASTLEFERFQQIAMHVITTIDLTDRSLAGELEFRSESSLALQSLSGNVDCLNFKASTMLHLIIRASNASHAMQHFTTYKKWNVRLMSEVFATHKFGSLASDPTKDWYEKEIQFLETYVIPLAQRLSEAVGMSCIEFLDFATANRMEWILSGQTIVSQAVDGLLQEK
jgi:hypothetical protein